MTTITGFTASRMKEIEDATIVDGNVVGDDLILERFDGGTINAGSVRGLQGLQGDPGEVTTADLNAAIAALQLDIAGSMPVGSVAMFAGATAPTNWMFGEGQAVSRATYSDLFALIGTTYGAGDGSTTFNLPDFRNRFPVAKGASAWSNSLNDKGGSADAVVVEHEHSIAHNHPSATTSSDSHTHGASHNHTASTNSWGNHTHSLVTRDNMNAGGDLGEPMISNSTGTYSYRNTTSNGSHGHTVTVNTKTLVTDSDSHVHTVDLPNFVGSSSTVGSSGTEENLPPFITINFMIKVL